MRPSRRAGAAFGAAAVIVLALAVSLPAQAAASSTWHVVFSHHYGSAANYSGYEAGVAPSKNDAWAFGGSDLSGSTAGTPVAEHWNGTAWHGSALPKGLTDTVLAASADSPGDVWALTHLSGDVLHWNGTSWSVSLHLDTSNGSLQFTGITAVSPTDVWAFGGPGFTGGLGTWHFNGSTWTQDTSAAGLVDGNALSASDIWAVGSKSAAEDSIWHYNGTAWQQRTAAALKGLQFSSILAQSATSVWAAATSSSGSVKPCLVEFNGTGWTRLPLPWAVDAGTLAPDGHGGLWMVVRNSTTSWFAHRSATGQWTRTLIGNSATASVFGLVQVPGTTSMWGFGLVNGTTGANAAVWSR